MTCEEATIQWKQAQAQFGALLSDSVQDSVAVEQDEMQSVDERLVQCIWHDQLFQSDQNLNTSSGKSLEIIEPGRWNTSRGPDFLDARIKLAGEILEGDIEIHLTSAGWTNHRHHQDFEYNNVILHVVLNAHNDRPYEEKQNGNRLERLVLEPILEPNLETIRKTINLIDYPYGRPVYLGHCHEEFLRLPPQQLSEFFAIAGRARIEEKVSRFKGQRKTSTAYQVLYQALMTSQGFKSSKTLYFLLSKRAPLSELLRLGKDIPSEQQADFFLSILLHTAHIITGQQNFADDPETNAFCEILQQHWRLAGPYFYDRLIPPTKRWFSGMRPAGFPTRRLAAVAILLGRIANNKSPLFDRFLKTIEETSVRSLNRKELREFWKSLTDPFLVSGEDHYFGTHYTLGGKKAKPQALLGEPAARSLLFNVFLPLALLSGRNQENRPLEKNAWQAIMAFPVLEKNSVTRFMEKRLFGESGTGKGLLRLEINQQAMLKIFSDCCASNERTCSQCQFYALASQMGKEQ